MSIAYSNTSMRVPAGFRNLLEGLAREVLREQPTNVVAFAAQYFQKLLEQREGEWPCPAPTLTLPSPALCCIACPACSLCLSPGHQACPTCPLPRVSVLPHVPTMYSIRPLLCAHHPGHQTFPLCPLPMALCLSQIPPTCGHQAFHLCHHPVCCPCPHHPWYQVSTVCGIKPPLSPAGGIDPVAWGAMLEDDRLTWPPSQVGCPSFQAPPENLRCQKLHWVPAPTLSLPPLCCII